MKTYIKKFENHNAYVAFTETEDFIKPNVSLCIQETEIHYNPYTYENDYLTFIALEDCAFSATAIISYSLDGEMWTILASIDESEAWTPTFHAGQKVMWKRNSNFDTPIQFKSTGKFDVRGNIMSLYSNNHAAALTMNNSAASLFANCKVVNAKNLVLPATTLSGGCYQSMFHSCNELITAPQILPSTTLAQECYKAMFTGCTNLITSPKLPATTLTYGCYEFMFQNCSSLTNAPVLPAITLADSCYRWMFDGCTNLAYIKALFTTVPSTVYTNQWVKDVSATGTFVKNSAAEWEVTGVNSIPSGWTIETASE